MGKIFHQVYVDQAVEIPVAQVRLEGDLSVPEKAEGLVLFAHGSGSSRFSPRNRFVARFLNEAGLATLLVDLLTVQEEALDEVTRQLRFDIDLLVQRLVGITDWLAENPATRTLKLGYFGASTGAAAAMIGAAERPDQVKAIVGRGGRPDLAGSALRRIKAPTLLIVGGHDQSIMALNEQAFEELRAEKKLGIISGATHLFEEPGALEQVARLARQWFERYLSTPLAR
jgi:dienelactone hydrolase